MEWLFFMSKWITDVRSGMDKEEAAWYDNKDVRQD